LLANTLLKTRVGLDSEPVVPCNIEEMKCFYAQSRKPLGYVHQLNFVDQKKPIRNAVILLVDSGLPQNALQNLPLLSKLHLTAAQE
jgi:hypothetical protein